MTFFKFITQSLKYYKKQHLAILLGTILSTAVLTGALIVGDSVKFSLQQLVNKRLGNITYAMNTNDRYVSDSLMVKLSSELNNTVCGVLQNNAIIINNEAQKRINRAYIYGINQSFWRINNVELPELNHDEIYVSLNVAQQLQLNEESEVLLKINSASLIPVNAPFAQEQNATVSFRVKVKAILHDDEFGRFSLSSNQKAPHNIFINKKTLQSKLKLDSKSNLILTSSEKQLEQVNNLVKSSMTLKDASVAINRTEVNQFELTSDRVFIDHIISDATINLKPGGLLTYLVNGLKLNTKETPYSFVSGVDNKLLKEPLTNTEIILNDWCANDLEANVGDSLLLKYYAIGPYKKLIEKEKKFKVVKIEPNQGELFNQSLTPNFPGLSDAESCSEWDTGVPIDLDRIRDKDEEFWNEYNATPKAVINLETAKSIWGNSFGNYTALRFAEKISKSELEKQVLGSIKPESLGLAFINVKAEGKLAANNSVNFGELFISLSFFVIASAVLLLVLLFTLNILARKKETGVLSALGFSNKKIKSYYLYESALTILPASFLGVLFGLVYNIIVLTALNTIWNDAVRTHSLEIYVNPATLFIGFVSGAIISLVTIYLVLRRQLKQNLAKSIKGGIGAIKNLKWLRTTSVFMLLISAAIVVFSLINNEGVNAELFLSAGGLMLVALMFAVSYYFVKIGGKQESTNISLNYLAVKNLARMRARSIMAISLLALGTFSVIITGANRKTFVNLQNDRSSGTGGFLYWVENTVPINQNLNSIEGKTYFNFSDEAIADSMKFIQFMTLSGNDASCLNLNQVQNPRILGLNVQAFAKYNAFSFTKVLEGINYENPWESLANKYGEGVIPAYVDQTVITWGLMKKLGDTLLYNDEFGKPLKLVIAGGLNNSIFQGNVLINEKHMQEHFPSVAGSNVMLIENKATSISNVAELLDFYFEDYGLDYELTSKRLAEFNSVENTYLNVFMILGGLGVAIGTIGFGIVLMRNRLERKQEFAILKAIGFTSKQLFSLIFIEHMYLLILGVIFGMLSASIGLLPSVISASYSMPVLFVIGLIVFIFLTGTFFIYLSARISNKNQIIEGLRFE